MNMGQVILGRLVR